MVLCRNRTAHEISSNMFISTFGNTDAAVSSRSRLLHLSSNEDYGKRSIDQATDSVPKRSKRNQVPNPRSSLILTAITIGPLMMNFHMVKI